MRATCRFLRMAAAMRLERNYSLRRHNTFGIDAVASAFVQVRTLEELRAALKQGEAFYPGILILGGGSNILFVQDFAGLVVQIELRGTRLLHFRFTRSTFRPWRSSNTHLKEQRRF